MPFWLALLIRLGLGLLVTVLSLCGVAAVLWTLTQAFDHPRIAGPVAAVLALLAAGFFVRGRVRRHARRAGRPPP